MKNNSFLVMTSPLTNVDFRSVPELMNKRFRCLQCVELRCIANNVWRVLNIEDKSFDFLIKPQNAVPMEFHLTPNTWDEFVKTYNKFDIIHLDPPWKVGRGNPLFGFSQRYETMNFEDIIAMDFLKGLNDGGLFLCWVVNAHIHNFIEYMNKTNLQFIKAITWIKVGENGKVQTVLGHYLSHGTEVCLLFVKGSLNDKTRNIVHMLPDHFIAKRTISSAKPQTLLRILNESINQFKYSLRQLDIFGRFNNLEPNWITVGLDAKSFSSRK